MIWNILGLILGFVLLVKGADYFVDGASGLAKRLHIPDLIIGLTIVAMGTSAPEAAVSITAGFAGNAEITIGNIVGSNILNILIILGVASVITRLAVAKSTIWRETPYMFGCSVLLLVLGLDGEISIVDGIILLVGFAVYMAYLFADAKKGSKAACEETSQPSAVASGKMWMLVLMIVGGLILLIIGSQLSVNCASNFARMIGISERFIGLTIVALGTSLPELFTSVIAARKGNADIAVGNIVGSNIFNILFIVGVTALLTSVPFHHNFVIDSIVMVAATVILFLCSFYKRNLRRRDGVIFLACYVAYFAYLCCI